jgi:hypothetical protein
VFRKDRSNSKSRAGSSKSTNSANSSGNPFNINYELFKSKEDAIEKLILDVKKFKVALPDNFSGRQLLEVHIIFS